MIQKIYEPEYSSSESKSDLDSGITLDTFVEDELQNIEVQQYGFGSCQYQTAFRTYTALNMMFNDVDTCNDMLSDIGVIRGELNSPETNILEKLKEDFYRDSIYYDDAEYMENARQQYNESNPQSIDEWLKLVKSQAWDLWAAIATLYHVVYPRNTVEIIVDREYLGESDLGCKIGCYDTGYWIYVLHKSGWIKNIDSVKNFST